MRKLVLAAVAAALLGALVPVLSHAAAAPPARLSDGFDEVLASTPAEGELLVFVHGTSRGVAVEAIDAAGLTMVGEFRSVGVPVAVGTAAEIEVLRAQPGVTFVEHNRPIDLHLDTARTATRADEAQGMTFATECATSPAQASTHNANQRALEATACPTVGPFDGTGQTIAVVDGGVDGTHPMFADPADPEKSRVVRNLKVACFDNIPGLTFQAFLGRDPATCPGVYAPDEEDGARSADEPFIVDMTAINDTDTSSVGGHGTHVAGIAAGGPVTTSDGRALQGLAPGAKVVALSMGLAIGIYGADAALDWIARHHADPCGDGSCPPITVVNNSYGSGGDWDPESVTTKIQERLIASGVVMVWANGNGDLTNDGGDGSDNRSGSDAAAQIPGVIAVANYDDGGTGTRDGQLNSSSSRGHSARSATWPDVSAPGTDITSACRPYLTICASGEEDPNYGTIGGTSMASPHVAGVVALLRQANPSLTPADVEDILEDTAHRFTFGAPYAPDPTNPTTPSSFDKGHGLIDVVRALTAATGGPRESSEGVPGVSACMPGKPVLVDEEGDATQIASVNGQGINETALDLRDMHVAWDETANTLRLTIHVTDLGDANPETAPNASWNATFTHDDVGWYVEASRDASGTEFFGYGIAFTADAAVTSATQRVPLGTITGAFDSAADTITFELPSSVLEDEGAAPLATDTVLRDFVFVSRRAATTQPIAQGAAADQPANDNTGCPYTLGYGTGEPPTEPPPPPPPPGPVDASLHDDESFETEATTTNDTSGPPGLDGYECVIDDPVCFTYRVEVLPSGSATLNVWLDPTLDSVVLDDWDLYVYDAAGNEVDRGFLGILSTNAGPQTATEIMGAYVDVDGPGTYTIVVAPYNVPADVTIGVHADLVAG